MIIILFFWLDPDPKQLITDPDPDPGKSYGSYRIRIRNTAFMMWIHADKPLEYLLKSEYYFLLLWGPWLHHSAWAFHVFRATRTWNYNSSGFVTAASVPWWTKIFLLNWNSWRDTLKVWAVRTSRKLWSSLSVMQSSSSRKADQPTAGSGFWGPQRSSGRLWMSVAFSDQKQREFLDLALTWCSSPKTGNSYTYTVEIQYIVSFN